MNNESTLAVGIVASEWISKYNAFLSTRRLCGSLQGKPLQIDRQATRKCVLSVASLGNTILSEGFIILQIKKQKHVEGIASMPHFSSSTILVHFKTRTLNPRMSCTQ